MANEINIIRGTTRDIKITLTDASGSAFVLLSGDILRLGVKKNYYNLDYVISKEMTSSDYSSGTYNTQILDTDTVNLDVGEYYYDVGLQRGNAYYNVIPATLFTIEPNITKRTNVSI